MKYIILMMIYMLSYGYSLAQSKVYGDFDGDGKKEYAYLVYPKTYINKDGDFVYKGMPKPAYTYIKFSKKSIPLIKIKDCLGGKLQNLGDLNGDKRDDIGLWYDWLSSDWHPYGAWMLRGNTWCMVAKPLEIHGMMWDKKGNNFKPIQKAGLGKVKIYYNSWSKDYEQILIKLKVVSIYP